MVYPIQPESVNSQSSRLLCYIIAMGQLKYSAIYIKQKTIISQTKGYVLFDICMFDSMSANVIM